MVYKTFFNVLLLVPFGIYLKNYFNCNFKKTVFYSFCYTLFFELTQLTGLYFIYPCGYRVFNVDYLILKYIDGMIVVYTSVLLKRILNQKTIPEKLAKLSMESTIRFKNSE